MLCFNHASVFYAHTNIMKMSMNNKFEAQTLIGNPTGNLRCHVLALRILHMSCRFGQSARSIESRCVVIFWLLQLIYLRRWLGWANDCCKYTLLQWRHNDCDGVSDPRRPDCFLNRFFQAQIKENTKALRHWPLWGEFTGPRWIPLTKGQ